MSRRRSTPITKFNRDDFDTDYDDDDRSNCQRNPPGSIPVQRNAANARERARMRVLSSAFSRLKTKLPWVPADTKLSKLDTLRLATIYIQQLRNSLATGKDLYYSPIDNFRIDANSSDNSNQTSLVWPFNFQSQQETQTNSIQNSTPEGNYSNRSSQDFNPWIGKEIAANHQYWNNDQNSTNFLNKFYIKHDNFINNNSSESLS